MLPIQVEKTITNLKASGAAINKSCLRKRVLFFVIFIEQLYSTIIETELVFFALRYFVGFFCNFCQWQYNHKICGISLYIYFYLQALC